MNSDWFWWLQVFVFIPQFILSMCRMKWVRELNNLLFIYSQSELISYRYFNFCFLFKYMRKQLPISYATHQLTDRNLYRGLIKTYLTTNFNISPVTFWIICRLLLYRFRYDFSTVVLRKSTYLMYHSLDCSTRSPQLWADKVLSLFESNAYIALLTDIYPLVLNQ